MAEELKRGYKSIVSNRAETSAFINITIDTSLEFRIVVLPRGFHPTIGNTTIPNPRVYTVSLRSLPSKFLEPV